MTIKITFTLATDAEVDALAAALQYALGGRHATDRQKADIACAIAVAWGVGLAAVRLRLGQIVVDLWWDDNDCTHVEATLDGYSRLSARVNARGVVYAALTRVKAPAAAVAV